MLPAGGRCMGVEDAAACRPTVGSGGDSICLAPCDGGAVGGRRAGKLADTDARKEISGLCIAFGPPNARVERPTRNEQKCIAR